MLCFGESVIALLIEPIFYDSVQVGSITAAFIMILCLCTAYFDIVDADEFLNLLIVRRETKKAIFYMNFQCIFSFSVFLVGVSLKTIIYVSNTYYLYEVVSGCGVGHHHEAAHRKLLQSSSSSSLMSWSASGVGGGIVDMGGMFDYEEELNRRLSSTASSSYTISQLDTLLFKSFILLCLTTTTVMMFSILIGYNLTVDYCTTQPPTRKQ
jgi:hypothetical protein